MIREFFNSLHSSLRFSVPFRDRLFVRSIRYFPTGLHKSFGFTTANDISKLNGLLVLFPSGIFRFSRFSSIELIILYCDFLPLSYESLFPFRDGIGKEVINLFQTSISNKRSFWTDANGRQMMKRVYLNH